MLRDEEFLNFHKDSFLKKLSCTRDIYRYNSKSFSSELQSQYEEKCILETILMKNVIIYT